MKGCSHFREALATFLEGELEGDAADAVAAHLEACPRCRAQADGFSGAAFLDDPVLALERCEAPFVDEAEWSRRWESIAAAIGATAAAHADAEAEEEIEPHIIFAAERAARLVRRLIPLAAAALVLLVTWAWSIHRGHIEAERSGASGIGRAFMAEASLDLPPEGS
jgi:hypothetical protein